MHGYKCSFYKDLQECVHFNCMHGCMTTPTQHTHKRLAQFQFPTNFVPLKCVGEYNFVWADNKWMLSIWKRGAQSHQPAHFAAWLVKEQELKQRPTEIKTLANDFLHCPGVRSDPGSVHAAVYTAPKTQHRSVAVDLTLTLTVWGYLSSWMNEWMNSPAMDCKDLIPK